MRVPKLFVLLASSFVFRLNSPKWQILKTRNLKNFSLIFKWDICGKIIRSLRIGRQFWDLKSDFPWRVINSEFWNKRSEITHHFQYFNWVFTYRIKIFLFLMNFSLYTILAQLHFWHWICRWFLRVVYKWIIFFYMFYITMNMSTSSLKFAMNGFRKMNVILFLC